MSRKAQSIEKLVFIYNADSGVINLVKDIAHKLLSPSTYPCSLCDLTYSAIGEKKSWVRFRKQLPVPQEYLHIDEFKQQYGEQVFPGEPVYPAILAQYRGSGEGLALVANKEKLDSCRSLKELKVLVSDLLR